MEWNTASDDVSFKNFVCAFLSSLHDNTSFGSIHLLSSVDRSLGINFLYYSHCQRLPATGQQQANKQIHTNSNQVYESIQHWFYRAFLLLARLRSMSSRLTTTVHLPASSVKLLTEKIALLFVHSKIIELWAHAGHTAVNQRASEEKIEELKSHANCCWWWKKLIACLIRQISQCLPIDHHQRPRCTSHWNCMVS